VAYLGGPPNRRRQQLRLNDPPPGGFAPTPHHLRDSESLHRQEQEAERRAQRRQLGLGIFERFAAVILFLLIAVIAVVITIMVALHT
jgi:hypothetical protein